MVGESGCGKSVTAHSILRLLPKSSRIVDGQILFRRRGQDAQVDLAKVEPGGELIREIRGNEIAMVFQEPMTSLSPVHTIGDQIGEAVMLHQKVSKTEARERAAARLEQVGFAGAKDRLDQFPHQLSGGLRQRAMIAMALSCNPSLLIADEPVSALDVSIQAQVLNLMRSLQGKFGLAYLFISHDLAVVSHISDRVAVMYLGALVETAPVDSLYATPRHPYTEALLSAIPKSDPDDTKTRIVLPGDVPNPANPPNGCRFHPRCRYARDVCQTERPVLREITPGHHVACHLAEELKLVGVAPPEVSQKVP